MSVGQPLQDIALVELPPHRRGGSDRAGRGGRGGAPQHCVLLRAGGVLSVLDMEQGEILRPSEGPPPPPPSLPLPKDNLKLYQSSEQWFPPVQNFDVPLPALDVLVSVGQGIDDITGGD